MKVTSAILKQIAAMPAEAMAVSLLFLAEQLEQQERKRPAAAERQSRYRNAHINALVTRESHDSNADITPLAPVVDNISKPSLLVEGSKEKGNLSVSQKGPSSKPLPEPEGFVVFMGKYPKRAGNANRKGALKAFIAARKRVDLQDLFDGADAYRAHCEETGKIKSEFVQQARTWLNADGWTEAYERQPNGQTPRLNSVDRAAAELLADIDEHWRRKDEAAASHVHGGDPAENVPRLRQNN